MDNWITLAVIGQPHGVSGRVKVKSFTDPADDFAAHSPITYADGTQVKFRITGHTQGMVIIEIEGVKDRNQAELLRGKKLFTPREAMPELQDTDQFYTADLIGMQVHTADGAHFGTVENVMNYGASDILEIARPGSRLELYAFTNATFPTLDLSARTITIDPPEVIGSRSEEQSDETA